MQTVSEEAFSDVKTCIVTFGVLISDYSLFHLIFYAISENVLSNLLATLYF